MNPARPWTVEYETYTSKGVIKRRFTTEKKARTFYGRLVRRTRRYPLSSAIYHEFQRRAANIRTMIQTLQNRFMAMKLASTRLTPEQKKKLDNAIQGEIVKILEG